MKTGEYSSVAMRGCDGSKGEVDFLHATMILSTNRDVPVTGWYAILHPAEWQEGASHDPKSANVFG